MLILNSLGCICLIQLLLIITVSYVMRDFIESREKRCFFPRNTLNRNNSFFPEMIWIAISYTLSSSSSFLVLLSWLFKRWLLGQCCSSVCDRSSQKRTGKNVASIVVCFSMWQLFLFCVCFSFNEDTTFIQGDVWVTC